MSASKIILFKVIFICFIMSVDSIKYAVFGSCEKVDLGINPLAPKSKIPGRYTGKMCLNRVGGQYTTYVHLEYLKDHNHEQCHIVLGETAVYHSQIDAKIISYHLDCPVICGNMTYDLIFNGCYKITLMVMDNNFKPISNNTFEPRYQYIKDSKDAEYFKVEPYVTLLNDHSNYIDITWKTGSIPVLAYTLKLCTNKTLNLDSDFEDCYHLPFCKRTDSYTVKCISNKLKIFANKGPKTLVFQHDYVDWEFGILKEFRTAIFKLNANFDINNSDIIRGNAHYLTANLTESEVTTVGTPRNMLTTHATSGVVELTTVSKVDHETKSMSHSTDGEKKSGGSGAIIACVVITVLVVVIALVVRTLYLRGHLRRYYHPSFRFMNPLSTNNDSESRVMVQ